ncbi:MAG TPA: GNAT family N-acetyltransferase [Gaiellaceae bacterium]|nr:GNAT family N-acetyltransferase [Gaiellaceae bacterium]
MTELVQPRLEQIVEFCGRAPIERVFLEDVARRGLGRFVGLTENGSLTGLCHLGANVVPAGEGCGRFARRIERSRARMIIGEEAAVGELWAEASRRLPEPREDRPGQPVFVLEVPPEAGHSGLRAATPADLERLLPACALAHEEELGVDPLARDAEGFRWRTRTQIDDGRSWVWLEDDVIRFKAEASAWTPSAVQLQQVWVDPEVRRRGYATYALRDLCRLLLARVPAVCLFVRPENEAAMALYRRIGMRHALDYRSLVF